MRFAQICDRVEIDAAAIGPVDASPLVGDWINANPKTSGIARMTLSDADGQLSLQAFGVGPEGLIDWGTRNIDVYTASPSSRVGAGFTCRYDFGFVETCLQGMLAKGLLVLGQLHSFKDASGRADHFLREYFALVHGRYGN